MFQNLEFSDVIGFIGTFCIILAYLLNQMRYIKSEKLIFPILNLIGAICLLYSLWYKPNPASIIIEFFWIGISLVGIYKTMKERTAIMKENL